MLSFSLNTVKIICSRLIYFLYSLLPNFPQTMHSVWSSTFLCSFCSSLTSLKNPTCVWLVLSSVVSLKEKFSTVPCNVSNKVQAIVYRYFVPNKKKKQHLLAVPGFTCIYNTEIQQLVSTLFKYHSYQLIRLQVISKNRCLTVHEIHGKSISIGPSGIRQIFSLD